MIDGHNKAGYFRQKAEEGVDHRRLFAGLVGNLADSSVLLDRMTEEQTIELRNLVRAYREVEEEQLRKIYNEVMGG